MAILLRNDFSPISNPVDVIEQIAITHDWPFERSGSDEISLSVAGVWSDYNVSLSWREDLEALHLACAFNFKGSSARLGEIYQLMAMINEQLWLGHFDYWKDDGMLLYRHGLLVAGCDPKRGQCEALLSSALETCERYYQAFQFVLWAGKSAKDALSATLFEAQGCA